MVNDKQKILDQKSLLIIFTYAPAGFGHLRVTDALYHGLSDNQNAILLETQDKTLTYFHRISSVHPLIRRIFEWIQQGAPEEIFTKLYRSYLHTRTKRLREQITNLINQRQDRPKTLLLISTHFGLAHQFGKIKQRIEAEQKLKMILVVQVTDDSPQKLWYVPEADIIFIPSSDTKQKLLEYGRRNGLREPSFKVVPFPISPVLTQDLAEEHYQNRIDQLDTSKTSPIQVMIPISGAAVGLDFFIKLCQFLYAKNQRFEFHILVKKTLYTEMFVNKMIELPYINLHVFSGDRQMVDQYEEIYKQEQISLEITKPSEQAFKALLSPTQVGGPILLFTQPVGRQEYDNLNFLRRKGLIPSKEQNLELLRAAKTKEQSKIEAARWRGVQLPEKPVRAAEFIDWLMRQNILQTMIRSQNQNNLDSNGVEKFWKEIAEFLKQG